MIRSFLTTTAVLALLAAPAIAEPGETLDVAAQFEIQGPEPSTSGFIFTRMGIAETLVNADADGRLTPGLATAWQVSEDGLRWTFELRDGVTFHDGSAMTPDPITQARVIALLLETAEREGTALMLVSHDAALIRHTADTGLALHPARAPRRLDAVLPAHAVAQALS